LLFIAVFVFSLRSPHNKPISSNDQPCETEENVFREDSASLPEEDVESRENSKMQMMITAHLHFETFNRMNLCHNH